jgi:hypothetical protein
MANKFEIVDVSPKTVSGVAGGFTSVQRVTFSTKPSGVVGIVDIPVAVFTPDEVTKVVGAQADLLETVKNL